VTADGQPVSTRTVDRQIVRDAQLTAGQDDGAVAGRWSEADQVGAGVGVGVRDGLPQRTGAAVGKVLDREGARDGPVLEPLKAQLGGRGALAEPSGTTLFLVAFRHEEGTCGSRPG